MQLEETNVSLMFEQKMAEKIPVYYLYSICLSIYVNFSGK